METGRLSGGVQAEGRRAESRKCQSKIRSIDSGRMTKDGRIQTKICTCKKVVKSRYNGEIGEDFIAVWPDTG